jgi:hypothetical protein
MNPKTKQVIEDYRDAYEQANGRRPKVRVHGKTAVVEGNTINLHFPVADLPAMANVLRGRIISRRKLD